MITERTPEQLAVEAETRRYCDHFEIVAAHEVERVSRYIAYRMWQEAVAPLQRMRNAAGCTALNFTMPQYVLHPDGRLERKETELPKETEQLLAQIDDMILEEARRYGVDEMVCRSGPTPA